MNSSAARLAAGVALALAGALIFQVLSLPLPFILGPMVGSAITTNLLAAVPYDKSVRRSGQLIIGVGLGGLVTHETLVELGGAIPLILVCAVILIAAGMLLSYPVARIAGVDRLTALLASLPAGMAEMASVARDLGARDDIVASMHAVRVVLIISTLPLWIDLSDVAVTRTPVPFETASFLPIVGLILAGGVLATGASRLGIINPWIIAPIVISAVLLAFGYTIPVVPDILIIVAQISIGIALGTRFDVGALRALPRAALAGVFSTLTLMLVSFGVLFPLVTTLMPIGSETALLAVAPGGLAEMVASSKALGLASITVAGFQMARLIATNMLVPPLVRLVVGRRPT